jgi:hypothetical protein
MFMLVRAKSGVCVSAALLEVFPLLISSECGVLLLVAVGDGGCVRYCDVLVRLLESSGVSVNGACEESLWSGSVGAGAHWASGEVVIVELCGLKMILVWG